MTMVYWGKKDKDNKKTLDIPLSLWPKNPSPWILLSLEFVVVVVVLSGDLLQLMPFNHFPLADWTRKLL